MWLSHPAQALDHSFIHEYALLTSNLALAEAALGWDADLVGAGLARQVFYSRQQRFQVGGELLDRHEKCRIECDQQVRKIADVVIAQSRSDHEAERLNRDRQAITFVS